MLVSEIQIIEYYVKNIREYKESDIFKTIERIVSEELSLDSKDEEELLKEINKLVYTKIYEGRPPLPQEKYLGTWKSGNAVKWFVEKYYLVCLYSKPRFTVGDLRKVDHKLYESMKNVFHYHYADIIDLYNEGCFEKISISNVPESINELFKQHKGGDGKFLGRKLS